jgi:uncharacterized protein (DUF1697 family)
VAAKPWIALLRAVNLGARNKVPMAELRRLLEEAGHESVSTYIASGNVLLRSAASRDEIGASVEQTIADAFGVTTTAIVRTPQELARVVAAHPFGKDTSGTFVTFLARKPRAAAVRTLSELDVAPEQVSVAGTHVYTRYPTGYQDARMTAALIERELGVAGTARNWRTVAKLAELATARRAP